MTPLQAIKAKCLDCSGGELNEVRHCPKEDCALHPFRRGKKPKEARQYSPEEVERLAARFRSKNAQKTGCFADNSYEGGCKSISGEL